MALVRPETLPEERPAERDASWQPLDNLPELALDHATIVDDGLWRLHARVADKVWFVRKALALLTEPFTLAPGAAALRGAARGRGRRGQLPPRRAGHGPARGHGLAALRGPGPARSPVPARVVAPRIHQAGSKAGGIGCLRALDPSRLRAGPCPSGDCAGRRDPDRLDLRRRCRIGEWDRVHESFRRRRRRAVLGPAGGPRDDHRDARDRVRVRRLVRRLRRRRGLVRARHGRRPLGRRRVP